MDKEITISTEVYKELCDKEEFLACILSTIEIHFSRRSSEDILRNAKKVYAENFGEEYGH